MRLPELLRRRGCRAGGWRPGAHRRHPSYLSLRGLPHLIDTVAQAQRFNPALRVLGIVPSIVGRHTLHQDEVLAELEKRWPGWSLPLLPSPGGHRGRHGRRPAHYLLRPGQQLSYRHASTGPRGLGSCLGLSQPPEAGTSFTAGPPSTAPSSWWRHWTGPGRRRAARSPRSLSMPYEHTWTPGIFRRNNRVR